MYQFPPAVRSFVKSLADLLMYANAQKNVDWCSQSSNPAINGVYGHAQNTIFSIVIAEKGRIVADRARELLNLGGNYSPLDDIEVAVQEAMDTILEEALSLTDADLELPEVPS